MGSASPYAQGRWSGGPGSAAERLAGGLVLPESAPGFGLAPGESVFALGPCFARAVELPLEGAGMTVASRAPGIEGLGGADARSVLAHALPEALLQELRWAAGAPFPEAALVAAGGGRLADPWLGPRAETGTAAALVARRAQVAAYFARALQADTVVITLGQAEGARDAETGLALPEAAAGRGRHLPEAAPLERVEAQLEEMLTLLGGRVVLTVSPEALVRTALGGDVITASLEGKAVLRLAAGRVAARHDRVDYFPLLEAALASDTALAWREDRRRPSGPLMGRAVQAFLERYVAAPAAPRPARPAAAADPDPGADLRAVRLDPAEVARREGVQIRPYDRRDWGGPDVFAVPDHARLTTRGRPVCRFPRLWTQEADALPAMRGTWLWGGPMKVHFGHLLVDSVARLWAFDRDRHDGVVFARRGGGPVRPWVFEVLARYGLGRRDVVVLDEPAVVEAVDFARPGSTLGLGPTRAYLDWLGARPAPRRRLTAPTFGEKLYLGRLHMAQKGTLMGESYFAGLLEAAGFQYLEPERHRIEDQARALRDAAEVVFLEGSSVYSVELLEASRARFHMIARRRGGDELFAPHIAPRAAGFGGLGADTALERFTDRNGRQGPAGPSRTAAPDSILRDMVAAGLVPEQAFDPEAFRAAERRDAAAHARGDPERAAEVVAWLDGADPVSP